MYNQTLNSAFLASLFLIALLLGSCSLHSCSKKSSSPAPTDTTDIPDISLQLTASGFTHPLGITQAGDGSGRMFIVEQGGLVKIIKSGAILTTPFLDVAGLLKSDSGEQGLLGMAFPRGYGVATPYVYINYTGTNGVGDTVISRYTVTTNPDAVDPASAQTVLTVVKPFTNHNCGQLAFGPDGYLYIGTGDGGSGGDPYKNAQNPGALLGKMLRIDVSTGTGPYGIPATNPFSGNPAYLPEIWSLGLRNPWRFSFDRQTGDLYIADVGQDTYEEVNVQLASSVGGENYGWNIMEGLHCYNTASCDSTGLTMPVVEYEHTGGNCSITGGYVYRGALYPALQGVYLYGDYCSGRIWGMKRAGSQFVNRLLLETGMLISTFGEDEAGNIYVADHGSGRIYLITSP
jgi:glucose/arabinose dehydrogenase